MDIRPIKTENDYKAALEEVENILMRYQTHRKGTGWRY